MMRNPSVKPKQSTARLGSSAKRAYVINRASITVFPVTEMFSGLIPSRSKYPRGFRGSEMEIRKVGRDAAIDLFRKGIILLPGAQACFDVPNRNVVVVRRERGGKRSGCIPLHKHQARAFVPQDPVEPRQAGRRHFGKALSRFHHP